MAKKDTKSNKVKGDNGDRTIVVNRKARYSYEIEESLEVGLALTGTEVKSARAGHVQIAEAYAKIESGPRARPEVWVVGMHIAPYEQGNRFNVETRRTRKLLMRRDQIDKLAARVTQKGYTLVPLKLYFTRGKAKMELGVGRGRKSHDKREAIAERDTRRDVQHQIAER